MQEKGSRMEGAPLIRVIDSLEERNLLLDIHREYDRENGFVRSDADRERLVDYLGRHRDTLIIVGGFVERKLAAWMRRQERTSSSSCDVVLMLDALHVSKGFHRQGIGTSMVSWLVDFARARGIPRIDLLASLGNDAAIRLYEKFGFTKRKRFQMMLLIEEDQRLEKLLRRKINEELAFENPGPSSGREPDISD